MLVHMIGFFKKIISRGEKEDILNTIEDYRKGLLPLIVPVTLIRHQVKKYNIEYLLDQIYLNPHNKFLFGFCRRFDLGVEDTFMGNT